MALAVIFGPLAFSALVIMTHILRRLNSTTSYLQERAREEEVLTAHRVTPPPARRMCGSHGTDLSALRARPRRLLSVRSAGLVWT